MHVYLSDERCVPLDHPQSNFLLNWTTLAEPLGIPRANVHAFEVEQGAEGAARAYDALLQNTPLASDGSLFDLALLGFGADGHTASLFPNSSALDEGDLMAAAAGNGPEGLPRITLTYRALNASARLWVMISGKGKSAAVTRVLDDSSPYLSNPIKKLCPKSGELFLWVDEEAAEGLR